MKPMVEVGPWEAVSRKAYWDRSVALEKWRDKVAEGHRSYLPDAVFAMDVREFVHFYGVGRFVSDWPSLRGRLPPSVANRAGTYDLAWSRMVGGGWNLRPTEGFFSMPAKRRLFLLSVSKHPGNSIYEIAKSLGMQYRRAHEHAENLVKAGQIRSNDVVEGGHRKRKLYPAYGAVRPIQ